MVTGGMRGNYGEVVCEVERIEHHAGGRDKKGRHRKCAHRERAVSPFATEWRASAARRRATRAPAETRLYLVPGGESGCDRCGPQPTGLSTAVVERQKHQAERGELREDAIIDDPTRVVRQLPGQANGRRRQRCFPPPAGQPPYREVNPEDPESAHREETDRA